VSVRPLEGQAVVQHLERLPVRPDLGDALQGEALGMARLGVEDGHQIVIHVVVIEAVIQRLAVPMLDATVAPTLGERAEERAVVGKTGEDVLRLLLGNVFHRAVSVWLSVLR
jgi:hypothetical protein